MSDEKKETVLKEKLRQDWESIRRQLVKDYPSLNRENLDFKAGEEEALLGRIERRIGKSRRELTTLLNNYHD